MRLFLNLLLLSWLGLQQAATQPLPVIIQQQAYQAMQASVGKDYKTVLSFTYPRLVELMGGPKTMLA